MQIDPKRLLPGTSVRHKSGDGDTVILSRRKTDGTGWWVTRDGAEVGGLVDWIIEKDWTVLDPYGNPWDGGEGTPAEGSGSDG